MVYFKNLDEKNAEEINYLYPGDDGKYWVNFNWYWEALSRSRPAIYAKLIYVNEIEKPVGFIAYGQHYEDRLLQKPLKDISEIYHIVVHEGFQGCGIGRAATVLALQELVEKSKCESVYVACHPDNTSATRLYKNIGFSVVGKNYDEDPLYSLDRKTISDLKLVEPTINEAAPDKAKYLDWYAECVKYRNDFNWHNWELGLEE